MPVSRSGIVTVSRLSSAAKPNTAWLPTGAIAENQPLRFCADTLTPNSGTLYVAGGIVIPANQLVTSITFCAGGTGATTPTNQWFCLIDQARNVLAKTVDDTSTAWNANTPKTLNLSPTYTPISDMPVYLGVVQVAATPAILRGRAGQLGAYGITPTLTASSTTGLTNPASLGATAAAFTNNNNFVWGYIS